MRKHTFTTGEYYHVYNRGVDKRDIFKDEEDLVRFIESINIFNEIEVFRGVFKRNLHKHTSPNLGHRMSQKPKLVTIVSYCILPNHFHFILKQDCDGGVSKFMQKFGNGYTKYFNTKNKRTGPLFGGKFKSKYVDNNVYLLRLFAYVNYNYKIHNLGHSMSQFIKSSDEEVLKRIKGDIDINPSIVVDQFNSMEKLKQFMDTALEDMKRNKILQKDLDL